MILFWMWLDALEFWLDLLAQAEPPPPRPSATVTDLAAWRRDHPADGWRAA